MKSKIFRISLLVLTVIALTVSLFACKDDPTTYTITYAAGEGATGSYEAGSFAEGATVTLPSGAALTKENHIFSGWTDGAKTYNAGAAFTMPASNVTLTAVWTAATEYDLIYVVGDDVTGSYTTGKYAAGASVTLPDGTALIKDDCNFGGWTDGTNTYAAGAAFTMPESNVTLTAIWNDVLYSVLYGAGTGATGSYESGEYAAGTVIVLPDGTALSKDNHTFSGWNDGTNTYAAGADFTVPSGGAALTAVWTENQYTLTYLAGADATGTYPAGSYVAGATVTLPDGTALSKDNHAFNGWTDGTNTYAAGATYTMPAGNVILSAAWVRVYNYSWDIQTRYQSMMTSVPEGGTFAAGETFTIEVEIPYNTITWQVWGWDENGRSVRLNDITVSEDGTFTMPARDIELYLQKTTPKQFTIIVDYNNGTTPGALSDTVGYGNLYSYAELKEPTNPPANKEFDYWAYDAEGVNKVAADEVDSGGCILVLSTNVIYANANDEITVYAIYKDAETSGGGTGGETSNGTVYVSALGEEVGNKVLHKIVHDETSNTIAVTYSDASGEYTENYTLTPDGFGDWAVSGSHVLGDQFSYISFYGNVCTLNDANSSVYASFRPQTSGGGEGEGGELGGNPVYTPTEEVVINYIPINSIEYDAANNSITVTYDGTETITYNLTLEPSDGSYTVDAYNSGIFGANLGWLTITATEINLYSWGEQVMATFYHTGNSTGGGEGEGGNEGGEVSSNPVYTPTEDVVINQLPINSIEYNASNGSILVTYDGTETITYTVTLDTTDGTYSVGAYNGGIFGTTFGWMTISDTQINLFNWNEQVMATFYISGGAGEGGEVSSNPVYTPTEDVVINQLPINSIEYNASNGSILVTYDGTETITYTVTLDTTDGTYTIGAYNGGIFGTTFGWMTISDTQINLFNWNEQVMATFYISGSTGGGEGEGGNEGGNEGGEVGGNAVYTPTEEVVINYVPINSIEYDATNSSITVTYDGTETITYALTLEPSDGSYTVNAYNSGVFGANLGWLTISATEINLYSWGEQVMATFYNTSGSTGGGEGEGGEVGGNAVYTPTEEVVINYVPINSIEYDATNSSITVTYDGTETITYALTLEPSDGSYTVNAYNSGVFGANLGWLTISATEINLYSWGEQVMATFYIVA